MSTKAPKSPNERVVPTYATLEQRLLEAQREQGLPLDPGGARRLLIALRALKLIDWPESKPSADPVLDPARGKISV